MKKSIFLFILLFTLGLCQAQEELPTISGNRPGYTWSVEVLQHKKISWENGFRYEKTPDGAMTMTLNSMMVRYGIFENAELLVGTDFLMFNDGQAMEPTFGINPLTIGAKVKVYEGQGFIPSVGLLAQVASSHIGSTELLSSHPAPSMYLLFEHDWDNSFWLTYNAGMEWDGDTPSPTTFLGIAIGYGITDDLGVYWDCYNYLHEDGNQHRTELGVTWLPSRKVQLDLEVGFDFQHLKDYFAVGCGVAWMIN